MKQIYGKEKPNFYLASYAKFLHANKDLPEIKELLEVEFAGYFNAYFSRMPELDQHQFHLSGSVAFYFSDIIKEVGNGLGLSFGRIAQGPIAGLALYHQSHD